MKNTIINNGYNNIGFNKQWVADTFKTADAFVSHVKEQMPAQFEALGKNEQKLRDYYSTIQPKAEEKKETAKPKAEEKK
jgi:hypothetical protein